MVRAVYLGMCGFWAALSLLMMVSPKRLFWLMAFGKFTMELENRWMRNAYRALGVMNLLGAVVMMIQLIGS